MHIMMIASECAPIAKVGGLADVVFGLGRELQLRGHHVEVMLPKYDCLWWDQIHGLECVWDDLWVPWYDGAVHCSVMRGHVHGLPIYFIDPHSSDRFFERGHFYGSHDDLMRFVFFNRAAVEYLFKSGNRPDVLHCHDWQTGLVPALLYEMFQPMGMHDVRACYTIHNFKHQGIAPGDVLRATGLHRPEHYFAPERMRDDYNHHALNLMKTGIVYSNFVTTVSPRHAWEARHTERSYGLGGTLHAHQQKFGGVLNGLDYSAWNPEIDPHIPHHYSAERIEPKYGNKDALRDRLWLDKGLKPIVAYVGRLDAQKGVGLVRDAIFHTLGRGAQFVLLGSAPDPKINGEFHHLKNELNNNPNCHIELGFNEQLAHLIYAGSDIVVVPSLFEPCGLTQLIGLRYGTVPVVRSVGGLADTVFDREHSDVPLEWRNGFVFHHPDGAGVSSALERALGLFWEFPDNFRDLIKNGMRADHSWNHPAEHYVNIYDFIRCK
jgi:starch synthase